MSVGLPLRVSHVRSLRLADCHHRRGRRGSPTKPLIPSTRQRFDIRSQNFTPCVQLPTLKTLHSALVADISFSGSVETLRKLLIQLGFRWKKTCDSRKVLVERRNIVSQRLSFYARKREFEDRCLDFVYVDETWVDTCYTVTKCWQGEGTPGVIPPCNRGQRIIVVHAGNRRGFIPGANLAYKAKSTTGDYHSEMDGRNFTKWLEEKLLPNLEEPSAIVLDNTSNHSMRADRFPTSNSRKADIQV